MIYTVFLVSLLFILSKMLLFQIRLTLRVNRDCFVSYRIIKFQPG